MKHEVLKKSLIKSALIAAVAAGLATPVIIYLYIMQQTLDSNYNKIKLDIANSQSDYKKTEEKLKKARASMQEYENIRKDKLPDSANTMDISSRIREARDTLQPLKERYRLVNLEMSLTTPTELPGILKKENITVSDSKVTLKFVAATDELALSFIDVLLNDFPGYIKIESLNMDRSSIEINDATLAQIRSGNLPGLVQVTMVFDWLKLQDGVPKTAAVPPIEVKP